MSPQIWIALAVGLAASVEDLARRQVSNWIPIAAFLAGLAAQTVSRGWRGALSSVLGTVGGFCIFLVFYMLGGMGGGDVKLMAGFGAVLGIERLIEAAFWTGAVGGVIALLAVAVSWLRNVLAQARQRQAGEAGRLGNTPIAIPYAPAIAIGAWLSLVPKA